MTEPERSRFEKPSKGGNERIVALGCPFAIWGAFLNTYIALQLWNWHFNARQMGLEVPYISTLLGLILGFVTPYALFSKNPQFALRSGYILVFIVVALFLSEVRAGMHLLVCFDQYAFSFLWALSLIAAGYFLRTAERRSLRDQAVS